MCSCRVCSYAASVLPSRTNAYAGSSCFVEDTDSSQLYEFQQVIADNMYGAGVYGSACWTTDATVSTNCLTPGHPASNAPARGGSNPSRVLFLVGDSHSLAMVATFGAALVNSPFSLAYTAMSDGGGFQADWPNPAPDCAPATQRTCNRQTQLHHEANAPAWVAGVRLALDAQMQVGDVLALVTAEWKFPHQTYIDLQRDFLRSIAQLAQRKGVKLLLVGDVPYLKDRGENCLTSQTVANCDTPRGESVWYYWPANRREPNAVALHQAVDAMHTQVAAEYPSTVTYLPVSWFYDKLCTATSCGAVVPGTSTLAYLDANHLSTAGSLYLAPFMNCYLSDQGLLT